MKIERWNESFPLAVLSLRGMGLSRPLQRGLEVKQTATSIKVAQENAVRAIWIAHVSQSGNLEATGEPDSDHAVVAKVCTPLQMSNCMMYSSVKPLTGLR